MFERALIASLADRDNGGCLQCGSDVDLLRHAAFAVREQLAIEQWSLVAASANRFDSMLKTSGPAARADIGAGATDAGSNAAADADRYDAAVARALDRLSVNVMAMTGAQTDRMTRDDGWRLLSIGRHVERMATLADALAEAFATRSLDSDIGFTLVLSLFDSTITYRSRYLQRRDPRRC